MNENIKIQPKSKILKEYSRKDYKKLKPLPKEYIERIKEKNPHVDILTNEYCIGNDMISLHCKKHNNIYNQKIINAINGNGCEECQRENRRAITQEEYIKRANELNPHIIVLGKYEAGSKKILCHCKTHNIDYEAQASTLITNAGSGGCFLCNKELASKKSLLDIQEILSRVQKNTPFIELLSEYTGHSKKVKCFCNICKQTFEIYPAYFKVPHKQCPVCSNKKLIKGFNDLATVRPDLLKWFVNPEEAYLYTVGQDKIVECKCQNCGHVKKMLVNALASRGFSCDVCGDGISYPNKFGRAFVSQLKDISNIKYEFSATWSLNKKYDIYFEFKNKKYIIEMDGMQHFKDTKRFKTNKPVKENDAFKIQIALENGIESVIHIDAKYSSVNYIKNSIQNSLLAELFDLSSIDWIKCGIDASSNLAYEVCTYIHQNRPNSTTIVEKQFKLHGCTINHYCEEGVQFGWCSETDYNRMRTGHDMVVVYDNLMEPIGTFPFYTECAKFIQKNYNIKIDPKIIGKICKMGTGTNKGFSFKYLQEAS